MSREQSNRAYIGVKKRLVLFPALISFDAQHLLQILNSLQIHRGLKKEMESVCSTVWGCFRFRTIKN